MDHYVAVFNRAQSQSGTTGDDLQLPAWGEAEWRTLFGVTTPRPFKASEVVIQRGVADRAGGSASPAAARSESSCADRRRIPAASGKE